MAPVVRTSAYQRHGNVDATRRLPGRCSPVARSMVAQRVKTCNRMCNDNAGNPCGGVGKRLTPAVLKTVRPERVSWVRIPPPPPSSLRNSRRSDFYPRKCSSGFHVQTRTLACRLSAAGRRERDSGKFHNVGSGGLQGRAPRQSRMSICWRKNRLAQAIFEFPSRARDS